MTQINQAGGSAAWRRQLGWVVQILCLAFAAYVIATDVYFIVAGPPTHPGDLRDFTVPQSAAVGPDAGSLNVTLSVSAAMTSMTLFAAFMLWRSRRNPTTMLLGMGLLGYGTLPQLWASGLGLDPLVLAVGTLNYAAIPLFFYAFAVRFFQDRGGAISTAGRAGFWIYAAIELATATAFEVSHHGGSKWPVIGDGSTVSAVVFNAGFVVTIAYLYRGWRMSSEIVRRGYALLLVATLAVIVAQALDTLLSTLGWFASFHDIANPILVGVIAPGLFTYSIFFLKVFDLGFAVNRTLVYGVVSAILLVGFGLMEWASSVLVKLVPPEGSFPERTFLDAAFAVTVFLTIHQLLQGVEHVIQRLFFQAWREKEAALARRLADAARIVKPAALYKAVARDLTQFADGAEAALYLRNVAGAYDLTAGALAGMPAVIDGDDAVVVALPADGGALRGSDLPPPTTVALALPMLNRSKVIGFVLMGDKPSGFAYRPDEIGQLADAVKQIGQLLNVREVEQLEALAARLTAEIAAQPAPAH